MMPTGLGLPPTVRSDRRYRVWQRRFYPFNVHGCKGRPWPGLRPTARLGTASTNDMRNNPADRRASPCASQRKYCCPHKWHGGLSTMANASLVAAIPNRLMLELNQTYNPLKEDIFKEPLVVKKGYMDLPSKPGFGVELIEDVGKKFPYLPGSYSRPNPEPP
jgi:hypothetical protein